MLLTSKLILDAHMFLIFIDKYKVLCEKKKQLHIRNVKPLSDLFSICN